MHPCEAVTFGPGERLKTASSLTRRNAGFTYCLGQVFRDCHSLGIAVHLGERLSLDVLLRAPWLLWLTGKCSFFGGGWWEISSQDVRGEDLQAWCGLCPEEPWAAGLRCSCSPEGVAEHSPVQIWGTH